MIGFEPATAVPLLVFVNKDKIVAREAQKIIKKSGILKDHPGFITALMDILPTGDLVLVANCSKASTQIDPVIGIEHAVYFDPACDIQSIGMSLYVREERGWFQKVTGNAVSSKDGFGYLTVAHAFQPQNLPEETEAGWDDDNIVVDDSESDEEEKELGMMSHHRQSSESSSCSTLLSTSEHTPESLSPVSAFGSDLYDTSRSYADTASTSSNSTSSTVPTSAFVDGGLRIDRSRLERLEYWSSSSSSASHQDWALVNVTNEQVIQVLSNQNRPSMSYIKSIAASPRSVEVVVCTTWGTGRLRASLLEVPILLRLPGSSRMAEVYQFTYRGSLGVADCGSLVLDERTQEIYGHVIAGAATSRIGYMIAASGTLEELERDHGWRLIDLPPRGNASPKSPTLTQPFLDISNVPGRPYQEPVDDVEERLALIARCWIHFSQYSSRYGSQFPSET